MTDNREKPTVIVSAFIEKDGKYLLTLDPKFGFWRVPGGRVEPNEKVEDTLVREMKEELNIEIKILEFCNQNNRNDLLNYEDFLIL